MEREAAGKVETWETGEGAGVKKFEGLMVLLPVTKDSSTIVLAVPSAQRDDFASALVGTQLLISRKIVTIKQ